jgi:hypothetical protein
LWFLTTDFVVNCRNDHGGLLERQKSEVIKLLVYSCRGLLYPSLRAAFRSGK